MPDKKPPTTPFWGEGVLRTRVLRALFLMLLAPGLMWGQAIAQKTDSSPNDSDVAAELKALRQALLQTQKQMASQQEEIEALKQQLGARESAPVSTQGNAPQVVNAALTSSGLPSVSSDDGASAAQQPIPQKKEQETESAPTFRVGTRILDLVASWILKIYTAPRTPRTTSPLTTPLSHLAIRHRAAFPSIVSPPSFPAST